MNTSTYENALEETKESAAEVGEAIGINFQKFTAENFIAAAIALILCVLAIWLVMRVLRHVVSRSRLAPSLGHFILKIVKIALEFIAILVVAGSLGFNVTALLAVFSLLGLALSLSVQNCLSNLMSGITILLTKPFQDGDYIEAGGVTGTARDIGLIYTELLTTDNKVIYVPNSDLSASKIVNYTREKNRRVDLVFGAGYEFPVETVKAALSAAMARVPGVLETPAPAVHVDSFAASNIQYSVRAWCHHEDYWSVYYALMEAVPAAFADAGVSMSYEHMNVHVLDTPTSAKKD